MKLFKHISASVFMIATLLAVGGAVLSTDSVSAVSADVCSNPNVSAEVKAANGCSGTSNTDLQNAIATAVEAVIGAVGVVAVIYIVVGGVNYITSSGDPGKVEKAKKTILYAAIGLAICALAFAIVNFVVLNVLGS